ncbi:hypothetical protein DERP_005810 [Dermatophagoides pteronyssinus]|uniref:Uncharacterized protein n=1 Tax=Dermatophagoides pteronyssinus TaxID=6956 RepID=A0ABQ8J9L8_DERPT|nr:hypothetical protein DERP_005810 [Dermatophagoides pteronyssinus]
MDDEKSRIIHHLHMQTNIDCKTKFQSIFIKSEIVSTSVVIVVIVGKPKFKYNEQKEFTLDLKHFLSILFPHLLPFIMRFSWAQ